MQRKKMLHNIRALKGGLDAWEKHGYPVEPMPADADASRYFVRPAHAAPLEGEYTVRATLSK
jgi:3-mercaptopyruvate sulfurtransferase SseA